MSGDLYVRNAESIAHLTDTVGGLSSPLKIRIGIRDQWDSPKAPIRGSIDSLTETLGHVITPQVEWTTLYNSLKDTFDEPSTFVPAICRIATAFYGRLLSRLAKDSYNEWTENFLVGVSIGHVTNLRLRIEADGALERPQLLYNVNNGTFSIHVPRLELAGNAFIEAGFDEDLDTLFGGAPSAPMRMVARPESELPKEENWVDVAEEPTQRAPLPVFTSTTPIVQRKVATSKIEDLPVVDLVARPNKLFKCIAPHVLVVNAEGVPLRIQGSHQPSLEYIASYLKKWARIDQNNSKKQPLLKVELIESTFFSGVIDAILIEPSYYRGEQPPLNPTIILGFVEGVLGYKEVFTNGTRWVFKLDPEADSETSLLDRNRNVI